MNLSTMDRKIEKKKWPPKKVLGLGLAAAFLFLIIYTFLFGDTRSRLNVQLEKITISTVTRGPFQEFIPITAAVIPVKTVYLDAVEGGRVEAIFMEAGSMVHKGDKILQLANTNLLLDIMFREAELAQQSNNLRNTRLAMEQNQLSLKSNLVELEYQIQLLKRRYERSEALEQENLISREEYLQVKDEYDYYLKRRELAIQSFRQDSLFRTEQIRQLEGSLARMERNLEIVRQKLDNLTIQAPISGQLTSLNAEFTGEIKSPGERLGQIDVLDSFKVRAAIDEHYLPRIEVGLQGEFTFAGKTYRLASEKIFPEIREGRFNVDLRFINDSPPEIRRGQTLHVRLQLGGPSQALLLARGGFYQKTGGQWVFVTDESGKTAVKRAIRLGRQNPEVFEVLEGLELGERVITSSYDAFGEVEKLILKE